MNHELLPFYEQELEFLTTHVRQFGQEYPREAGFLALNTTSGQSNDPHIQRLLQAVALMAARIRQKINDDFPELTDALLSILCPHYLAPLPSMLVAQLLPNTGLNLAIGPVIARGEQTSTSELGGAKCDFRTVYPIRLWPVQVASPNTRADRPNYGDLRDIVRAMAIPPSDDEGRLRLVLEVTNGTFEQTHLWKPDPQTGKPSTLRLYFGPTSAIAATLYEYLFNQLKSVMVRAPGSPEFCMVPIEQAVQPVGFSIPPPLYGHAKSPRDEGVLPYPSHVFPGYRLLTEFFAYRNKFWFIDLGGWDRAKEAGLLNRNQLEFHFFFKQAFPPEVEEAVNAETFKPGCAPMVNLFTVKSTEPIIVTQRKYEYPLTARRDSILGTEVYSIDRVYYRQPTGEEVEYQPFYSFRHQDPDYNKRYWFARRRPSFQANDRGTDVDVHFVDSEFNPLEPAEGEAYFTVTCCNRDWPQDFAKNPNWSLLPFGSLPTQVRVVSPPTPTRRPIQKRTETGTRRSGGTRGDSVRMMNYWRLISHLSLNHLSFSDSDPDKGRLALTEYLSLYDFSDDIHSDLQVEARHCREGVRSIRSKRAVAYLEDPADPRLSGYVRGVDLEMELDEDKFVGVGSYLFASVMERFLAAAVSLNSFTRLTYRTTQRGEVKVFPTRAGDRALV